jgi:hypothetical protein
MTAFYLAIRAYLELAGVAALVTWGWNATPEPGLRLALAVVPALLFHAVWSIVVSPTASNSLPQLRRVLIGSGLLMVTAFVLHIAGQPALAVAFATMVLLNLVQLVSFARFAPSMRRESSGT